MLRKGEYGLTFSSSEVSEGHFLGVWGVFLGRQQGQPVTLQQHPRYELVHPFLFSFGCAASSLPCLGFSGCVSRLSCPVACEILVPHQGSNLCPLCWREDS